MIVFGAGVMGLAAAYHAVKAGHDVQVFEAATEAGGMAAHFDMAGTSIERFYHFVCKTDRHTFALLADLGIADQMRWRETSMGLFTNGRLRTWGNPVALMTYPGISFWSRLRYALFAFVSVRRNRWDAIESESARSWITRWCGQEVYDQLWRPLFELKFYQFAGEVSAKWIWTRIRRIGRSRKSMMQEELGYIEGGSQTLVDAVCSHPKPWRSDPTWLRCAGGSYQRGKGHWHPDFQWDRTCGRCHLYRSDSPGVYLVPDLPLSFRSKYDAIRKMGVCCLVFKLKRSVSPHFWVNISVADIEVPGIIEFSNLRSVGAESIVYVPYYMPNDFPKFGWTDEALLNEAFSYLQRINPSLQRNDILSAHVARLRYAQPLCPPGFAAMIPPVQTPIAGLQIADTCFYYPEDRGISESVRLGREMAMRLGIAAKQETGMQVAAAV